MMVGTLSTGESVNYPVRSLPWQGNSAGVSDHCFDRRRETFKQLLLARLDLAIASAAIDDVYVDEVNAPKN